MSDKVPDHVIAEIRERTDVVEIVGRYVSLRRAGNSWKGLCPFHDEKTPSFNVNPSRQFFHCFGCGESGDVIAFLMKIEGKPFMEVVRDLAAAAGVDLPERERTPQESQRDSEREQCFRVNALACEFFEAQLRAAAGGGARTYIQSRDLGQKVVGAFRLGYAPAGWDALTRFLAGKKVEADLATKLGLVVERRNPAEPARRGGAVHPDRHFDFFRDRLMFPIIGPGDRVLGFSGRLLDPTVKDRKYVNSPESPVYRKGETLFGLPVARPAMRKLERALLVEGNVDVLALHQAGYEETVAPLGTALTARQVSILRRYVPLVVLCYDGDDAGRAAARKAAELLAGEEILSRVVTLPDGVDPADLMRAQPERMGQLIGAAPTGRSFLIESIAREGGESVEGRVKAAQRLAPLLARIPGQVERQEYAREAAAALGLRQEQILGLMGGDKALRIVTSQDRGKGGWTLTPDGQLALGLLGLLSTHPHLAPRAEGEGLVAFVQDPLLRDLIREAIQSQARTGRVEVGELLERVPSQARDVVARALLSDAYQSDNTQEMQSAGVLDASRAFVQIRDRFRLARLEQDLSALVPAIREAEVNGPQETRNELILRRIRLSQEKDELVKAIKRG
ncbi:MAG: DNA primase [Polyangia bacterium]|nr:DNA primase [Polyangia bacterium]